MIAIKAVVISDTHIKKLGKPLPKPLQDHLADADAIFHCGDIIDEDFLGELEKFGPVYAVRGNGDFIGAVANLPEKRIIEIGGYKIGILHGHGDKGKTVDRASNAFREEAVDIILFGHSHQPMLQAKSGVLMLNPGSPTTKRREKQYSFIILHLEKELHCEFVFF
ncbi:hypothetical protein SAMN02745975_01199 [Geosporobacter subterraneus DSM 17957]|uniref:Phosphoesterase n=1 Tax=Geosporobacter subterraneus DSM 17957 TaxID=1121919 RepID=A0A1M6G738_9FIRM|nr:metallophosphoesterase family protein [Geosporobacter subterraneus]SHJ05755.1 hypothetical protein SAMN02745975_01199 [Geosporobacter subterraneus DSM 17957]